jgi:hypothetical protein
MSKLGKQIVIGLMLVFSFMSLRSIYYYILSERELKRMAIEWAKEAEKTTIYCPITHFFLGFERAAYHTDFICDGEPVPCDERELEKYSMFAIDENGYGIINFEKNEILLKPSKARFQKGTTFWAQTFSNDSLNLTLQIDNYKVYSSAYYYNTKMTLIAHNNAYTYELIGHCDSIAFEKLRKNNKLN